MDPITVDTQTQLRLVHDGDAEAIAEANGSMSTDDALRWIAVVLAYHASGEEIPCAICVDSEAAGYVFLEIHRNREGLLHYGLAPRYRGKGIATSACGAMIRYAFSRLGLEVLKDDVPVSNERSCLVAERLGFVRAETIPNPVEGDIARYRLTAAQWSGRDGGAKARG